MVFTVRTTKTKGKILNHEHEKNKIIVWYLFGFTKGQNIIVLYYQVIRFGLYFVF